MQTARKSKCLTTAHKKSQWQWPVKIRSISTFVPHLCVEALGPGRVLAGLAKKIVPVDYEAEVFAVNNLKTLEKFLSAVK